MTTKSDIIEAVSAATGHTKSATKEIVDSAFAKIGDALVRGDKVQIAGLGTFAVKDTAARVGRNPATGAAVDIPAGKKLTFKPASDLKASL